MRYIDLDLILPNIRHLLADLQAAHDAVMHETDPTRRARLIRRNRSCWVALREAFEAASYCKCWYTECKNPGADNDIDHYRPKLGVTEDRSHPGYYWLAFNWRNMRLSCQRANRPRRSPGSRAAGGKADHFPLLPNGLRATVPTDDISREFPGLLDPTDPLDPALLSFKPNGEIDLSPQFRGDPIAEAKISMSRLALHLNWPRFVDARVTLYNLIERTVARGEREAPANFSNTQAVSNAFKDAIRDLHAFMSPWAEYSAAARVYVESFKHVWWVRDVVLRLPI
jgi:hypothetical protein